jgi:hypothetical protein
MATLDVKRSIRSAQPCRLSFPLSAVQHIRRMRGGAQAHLMRASDGRFYVTKFQNNPLHPRVLANELLATRLGLWFGLPMPQPEVIEVSGWLIAHNPALRIEIAESRIPCSSGLQLASRYVADPERDQVFDHLPKSAFKKIVNRQDLVRVLAFDKWVGNCDSRQAVFSKRTKQSQFEVTFIDQGYCFNAGQWTFPDLPLMGTYERDHVYRSVTGWDSFEPVLSHIEEIDYANLWRFAAEVPQEWYQYDAQSLCQLVDTLYNRRSLVRNLITNFRFSMVNPFPKWLPKDSLSI